VDRATVETDGVMIDQDFAERTMFVVTPNGKIFAAIGGATPTANVEAALNNVRQISKAKSEVTFD
jgi:peroxiredoxin